MNDRVVLVTGATGFVGARLLTRLQEFDAVPVAAVRSYTKGLSGGIGQRVIGDLKSSAFYKCPFDDVNTIVHCAARAHVLKDRLTNPLNEYRRVNVDGTLSLAKQAVAAGVKRFIFISSIKVNGEFTDNKRLFTANDEPAPEDPYGISKLEAERGLLQLAAKTDMAVVIIRPPLVYGLGVKGNFASMINLLEKELPLPLGSACNKRSLIFIDNLVDLIIRCIDHPAAVNQIFLASDGMDLSTTELLRNVGYAMGKPARLFPVPSGMLQFGATLLGKKAMAQRLLGSLQVDISKTCEMLDWKPPYTVQEGLRRCFERSN